MTDAYPNFSIPYYVSGDVSQWTNLAHHSAADCQGWSSVMLMRVPVGELEQVVVGTDLQTTDGAGRLRPETVPWPGYGTIVGGAVSLVRPARWADDSHT